MPGSMSIIKHQNGRRREVSIVLTPLTPDDTHVCSPALLSPCEAGAEPSQGMLRGLTAGRCGAVVEGSGYPP